MTKKEIIERLEFIVAMCLFDPSTGECIPKYLLNDDTRTTVEAFEGAIALLSGDVPNTNDGDMISRQAAIEDAHRQIWYRMNPSMKDRIDEWLEALPSVSGDD